MRRAFATLLSASLAACGTPAADGVDVVLTDTGAGNPTVAVDTKGAAYAAWIETSDAGSDVFLAEVSNGARGAPVRVNDVPGDAAPHDQAPPQVEVGSDGAVYVVWQNNTVITGRRFPASNLRFARSTDGGRTFAPAIFVNDDALGEPTSHSFHDMAVTPDGTIYVSWIDGRARAQAEAAGAQGHAHGVAMPGSEVRVAKSTDGGRTFAPGVVVHRDACPCCRTTLAVAPDGTLAVAFRLATRNIRDMVVVRSSDAGATFGEPLIVHEDGWLVDSCPHAGASLAYDADGRMHIAWYTGAEERQGLWYARATADGTAFETPQPLQTGGWVPVSQVKLDAAADGDVWIAWDDRREETSAVRLAVARDGSVRELAGTIPGKSPAIAADDDVIVGWQNAAGAAVRVIRTQ